MVLVSCLCITENRPGFVDWLLWNYDRQTWDERELVIVDSSAEPFWPARDDVRVIETTNGSVAYKMNVALAAARGEVIVWFDDDDWQHPDKCKVLVEALGNGTYDAVGATAGWFVDLKVMWCTRYEGSPVVLLPTMGARRRRVSELRFIDGDVAVDTAWLHRLHQVFDVRVLEREDLSFWLCHEWNLYNRTERWPFDHEMTELRRAIGPEAWGDTDEALAALWRRLWY